MFPWPEEVQRTLDSPTLGCESPALTSNEPMGPIASPDDSTAEQGCPCEQVGLRLGEEGKQEPETAQDQTGGNFSLENLTIKSKGA